MKEVGLVVICERVESWDGYISGASDDFRYDMLLASDAEVRGVGSVRSFQE